MGAYYLPGTDAVFGGEQDEVSVLTLVFPCFILSMKPCIYKAQKQMGSFK